MSAGPEGTDLRVILDVERDGLPGITRETLQVHCADGEPATIEGIGLMRHGTVGGNAVAHLSILLPDGTWVVAQTTWKLLATAVDALKVSPIGREEL